jgi:hypothetical protein
MISRPNDSSPDPDLHSFSRSMRLLGETFAVRDVMVPLIGIKYVAPGDEASAIRYVDEKRYSVIPVSRDGAKFDMVFETKTAGGTRAITALRHTIVSDYIPELTPLTEAFFLFESREWYLTLRGNRVSGLITYWAFNTREFRVQLYTGISRVEELSRDALAKDSHDASTSEGINISPSDLEKIRKRFDSARKEMGGNRFVDELQFSQVNEALRKQTPWREFLHRRLGENISNTEYKERYDFTDLRNGVMHGRVLFPTYRAFKQFAGMIDNIGFLVQCLDAYIDRAEPAT